MNTDYIPSTDSGFDSWLTNFSTLLTGAPTDYGLTAPDAVIVAAERSAYHTAYVAATDPSTRTVATIAAKDAARVSAESIVRPYAVSISMNSGVLDADKAAIGVTIRVTTPTPIPPPLTTPGLALVSGAPLGHTLRFFDTSTPTTKSKPFGALGMQVMRSVGVAPAVDPSVCPYYATWTKSPNVSTFESGQQGKVATYFARWVTRGGPGGAAQYGPWSAPLSLVVM